MKLHPENDPEVQSLVVLSARLGRNSLLTQGSTGNTSIKTADSLWIKASGKSLADAEKPGCFVSLNLSHARACVRRQQCPTGNLIAQSRGSSKASIETAMHAVLPFRVVLHVHSIHAIAWAVLAGGEELIASRLQGLCWRWIPYVDSGLPLAREIECALSYSPATRVFVLANHGLVVCGDSCAGAEALLLEVERRLEIPRRSASRAGAAMLERITSSVPKWRLPKDAALHALGTDPLSRAILRGGILYPCQAIFLGPEVRFLSRRASPSEAAASMGPYLVLEGGGVLLSSSISAAEYVTLAGLVEVVQRLSSRSSIKYLTGNEVSDLLSEPMVRYRDAVDLRPCSTIEAGQSVAVAMDGF